MTFSDMIQFLENANVFNNFQAVQWYHYVINIVTLYVYYILIYTKKFKDDKNFKVRKVILLKDVSMVVDILLSLFISTFLLIALGSMFLPGYIIGSIVGTKILSIKVLDKLIAPQKSGEGTKQVVINVNSDSSDEESTFSGIFLLDHELEKFIPDIKEEEINHLDIISVLEKWGFISQNQKCKMNDMSLFETPDEMTKHLLDMQALTTEELNEAKAILNLTRIKKRPISRSEAINMIMKMEERKKQQNDTKEVQTNDVLL